MDKLKLYWAKAQEGFWTLISKIESSVLFEKLVSKYESLPIRHQQSLKSASTVFLMILLIWMAVSPLLATSLGFRENRDFFKLLSSIRIFNSKVESSKKEYISPVGWQPMNAGDLSQLEAAIINLMATLGFQDTQYKLAQQNNSLVIHASEATIKQLETFLFQIDGLFPKFSIVRNKVSVHPENKDLLQFEIEITQGEISEYLDPESENSNLGEDSFDAQFEKDFLGLPDNNAAEAPSVSPPKNEDGSAPSFDSPSFTPLDDEGETTFEPAIPSDRDDSNNEFIPPVGDEFIPPPPPNPDDDTFEMAPIPDDDFPPPPPFE